MSNDIIRAKARNQLSGNYWNGIVATISPSFIFWLVAMFAAVFVGESYVGTQVVGIAIAIFTTYMITKMSLTIAKGSRSPKFEESLSPSDSLVQAGIYIVILQVLSIVAGLVINLVAFGQMIVEEADVEAMMEGMDPTEMLAYLWSVIGISIVVMIVVFIIAIRFVLTVYIIVDQRVSFQEGVMKSIQYTKGNVLRIIGYQLFFIGWYFLSVFTCGILLLYVIPYQQIGFTHLYLQIKKENGDAVEEVTVDDPFENEEDVLENREFNTYYE